MQIGYIGLGKMGKNMTHNLLDHGYDVVATDLNPEARQEVELAGAKTVTSLQEMVDCLEVPRLIWVMVPAGKITQSVLDELSVLLDEGDTIINGGNSFFKDSIAHGDMLGTKGVRFIDVGVSGGQDGARNGACLMVGGSQDAFDQYEQLFADLAAPEAYQFFPGHGTGHYVKMVHNGIEYGMMQAIAEGFDLLKNTDRFAIDVNNATRIYSNESIIASRLIDWMGEGYREYGDELESIAGSAGSGGAAGMSQSEAVWTLNEAREQKIAMPVIQGSVDARVASQESPSYQGKLINTLRNMFGGHKAKKD